MTCDSHLTKLVLRHYQIRGEINHVPVSVKLTIRCHALLAVEIIHAVLGWEFFDQAAL